MPLLAPDYLRRVTGVDKGVLLYLVPLNSIMEQQARDFSAKMSGVGTLSVGGKATKSTGEAFSSDSEHEEDREGRGEKSDEEEMPKKKARKAEEEPTGEASFGMEELQGSQIKVIIAHAESFHTTKGREILSDLAVNKRILGVVVDEAHKFLHWASFRPKMGTIFLFLLCKSGKAPVVLLTAILTPDEVKLTAKKWLLKNPLVLKSCPVLPQHILLSFLHPPSKNRGGVSISTSPQTVIFSSTIMYYYLTIKKTFSFFFSFFFFSVTIFSPTF